MEISNLLTSTSGVYDITKTTLEDMTKYYQSQIRYKIIMNTLL